MDYPTRTRKKDSGQPCFTTTPHPAIFSSLVGEKREARYLGCLLSCWCICAHTWSLTNSPPNSSERHCSCSCRVHCEATFLQLYTPYTLSLTRLLKSRVHVRCPILMPALHPIIHLSPVPTGMDSFTARSDFIPISQFHIRAARLEGCVSGTENALS